MKFFVLQPKTRIFVYSGMTNSSTNDSLVDAQINGKSFTPSMTSSGYDSQAVSSQTLSSEDSASVRSMSIDDTPELDGRKAGSKTGKLVQFISFLQIDSKKLKNLVSPGGPENC